MKKTLSERFWEKVDKNGPIQAHCPELGPCWTWLGGKDSKGYGAISVCGVTRKCHQVAYELTCGPVLSCSGHQACVLHKCDNRSCCNPLHLFVGTRADNAADRDAKGRQARGDRQGLRLHPDRAACGERNGQHTHPESRVIGDRNGSRRHPERLARGEASRMAKLDAGQVRQIRDMYRTGRHRQVDIAALFGIKQPNVSSIVRREAWRHVK